MLPGTYFLPDVDALKFVFTRFLGVLMEALLNGRDVRILAHVRG